MTTIELTEEDAAILLELIAERKSEKEHRKMMQSFWSSDCEHGIPFGHFCLRCVTTEK